MTCDQIKHMKILLLSHHDLNYWLDLKKKILYLFIYIAIVSVV